MITFCNCITGIVLFILIFTFQIKILNLTLLNNIHYEQKTT